MIHCRAIAVLLAITLGVTRSSTLRCDSPSAPSHECPFLAALRDEKRRPRENRTGIATRSKHEVLHYRNFNRSSISHDYVSPKAAATKELVWDGDLDNVALKWAHRCKDNVAQICTKSRSLGSGVNYGVYDDVEEAKHVNDGPVTKPRYREVYLMNFWYHEDAEIEPNKIAVYRYREETAHIVQILWGKTGHFGCAKKDLDGGTGETGLKFLVCVFDAARYAVRREVYVRGNWTDQRCPVGYGRLRGVCVPDERIRNAEAEERAWPAALGAVVTALLMWSVM